MAKQKLHKYRVEYLGKGGSWGSDLIEAPSPQEAEKKMNWADFAVNGSAKATHRLDPHTGQLIRIAL